MGCPLLRAVGSAANGAIQRHRAQKRAEEPFLPGFSVGWLKTELKRGGLLPGVTFVNPGLISLGRFVLLNEQNTFPFSVAS